MVPRAGPATPTAGPQGHLPARGEGLRPSSPADLTAERVPLTPAGDARPSCWTRAGFRGRAGPLADTVQLRGGRNPEGPGSSPLLLQLARPPWPLGTLGSTPCPWCKCVGLLEGRALAPRFALSPHSSSPDLTASSTHLTLFPKSSKNYGEVEHCLQKGRGWEVLDTAFLPAPGKRTPNESNRTQFHPLYFYSHHVFWHFPEDRVEERLRQEGEGVPISLISLLT